MTLHMLLFESKCTYITLKVVDLSGLHHIIRVWQTSPLVQVGSVVEVIDLDLTFLGQLNSQHVDWQVELGLSLLEVLLIDVVTGDPGCVSSQQDQWVIVHTEGANVVATLLAETSLVFVLKRWGCKYFNKCYIVSLMEI